jgi:hypothetical protein
MSTLYYSLNKNIQPIDLKKVEKEELIDTTRKLDLDSKTAMFMLIYQHLLEEKKANNEVIDENEIPYFGVVKYKENGEEYLEFNLGKIPINLRRILYKFCKILQKNEKNI